jgi:lipopolysaccharide transport system permease protein
MVWYQFVPSWRLVTLPLFVVLAIIAALGPGLIVTALTVRYRDFRIVIPFIVQFGMYISPVAYSTAVVRSSIGEWPFLLYSANPMVGVIDGFRWAILGGASQLHVPGFVLSVVLSVMLLVVGIWYFRKTERVFADVI